MSKTEFQLRDELALIREFVNAKTANDISRIMYRDLLIANCFRYFIKYITIILLGIKFGIDIFSLLTRFGIL